MTAGALLTALAALTYEAGREVARLYRDGCNSERKTDGSPVTDADRLAETIISEGLATIAPGVSVVGEEAVAFGVRPQESSAFFLVDPLDGTNEFIERRTGEFTVNIGLIEDGRPRFGVVYAPITGALFAGGPEGAFRADCDPREKSAIAFRPIRVAAALPAEGLRVVVSRRSPRGGEFDAVRARLPAHRLLEMSSSLKLCAIAEGDADVYPRFGPVSEWDLAAGHGVLAAAGGGMIHLDGAPLTYRGSPESYEISRFAAFGGAAAERSLRRALSL